MVCADDGTGEGQGDSVSRGPTQNTPTTSGCGIAPFSTYPLAVVAVGTLLLVAVFPYLNILANGFVYDDNTQVLNNPYLQNSSHLPEVFSTTVWSYVGVQGVTNYYRPMMTFGYLICFQVFGPLAYGFHLMSLLLHAGVVFLLFLVTLRMTGHRLWAYVAAGLFALHPVHTESVAWIAAVTDLQLTFFYLLTFYFFLCVARPGGGREPWMQLAMAGSFVLTLLSKEQSLTLPVLAVVYEHFVRDGRCGTTTRPKLGRHYLLWMLSAAYLLFRIRFFGALAPVLQISDLTWGQTILSAVALVGQYIGKLLWPVELSAFYVFRRSVSLFEPRVLAGFGALIILALIFAGLWRRSRIVAFAIIWMMVTLAPVLNPRWMAANVFTERYLYLPSVGFCWLVAWGWVRLYEAAPPGPGLRRKALIGTLAAMAALYAVRVVTRNRDWSDDVTLYAKTLEVSPDAYHIRNNLGTVLWKQGRVEDAEREWVKALELSPRNAIVLNNLGLVRTHQKKFEEAAHLFQRAMRLKPNYTDPHLNLGSAYQEMGMAGEAELHLRAAVALSPLNFDARNKLATVYLDSGRLDESREHFARSAQSQPNWMAYQGLGEINARLGDHAQAEEHFRRALELNPVASEAHFALGAIHASAGRTADAIREYEAGLATDPVNEEGRAQLTKLKAEKFQ
jgi:tetratricopeptide (TPR) repeat protein